MYPRLNRISWIIAAILFALVRPAAELNAAEVVGMTVTPHRIAEAMRYRQPRDTNLSARVQLFVRGAALPGRFDGQTPVELLTNHAWAWHDLGTAVRGPEDSLSVWTFNGKSSRWGVGRSFRLEADGLPATNLDLAAPTLWISAATFLSTRGGLQPDLVLLHVANEGTKPLVLSGLRFWLPENGRAWATLRSGPIRKVRVEVPAGDKGWLREKVDPLPLTYAAIELITDAGPLWAHLRIKRESFDISGGWVGSHASHVPYLQALEHFHVNTGQIENVPGYTDRPELYAAHPLQLFNRLMPLEQWDTEAWLPHIHAVEFLGEPQYGGGRPVPPQEVFDKLLPYRPSRLATSVTHSEERIWRDYAGLSDFPHYDAYRVTAPSPDAWGLYDRWGPGVRLRWGAPLETIGDMCRSLRELNRPMPCAFWSQGPHHDWRGYGGRQRGSPTPDELRAQALHALSTRITSLYWFNLSLEALLKFPDTWEPMTRIGREIRMLEPFFLEGDAYRHERRLRSDGSPDWDLASVVAPRAAVLFALDLAYSPDPAEKVFRFGPPRPASFAFELPAGLRRPEFVYRVDADGLHDVVWRVTDRGVAIDDTRSRDAIYVATSDSGIRGEIELRRARALAHEAAHPADLESLRALAK